MLRDFDTAFAAMASAATAVVLVEFLNQLPDSTTSTTTTTTTTTQIPMTTYVHLVLSFAATAMAALFAAVALIFRHLQRHAAAGNRRLSDLVAFTLFTSAAILEYVIFADPADAGVIINGVGARARALGLVAARMLPASATATFFLGMALVSVRVCAGGGGRGGAGDGDGHAVGILSKMALEAAAVLVGLMTAALCTM
jgi:hypothetical protein